MTKKNTGDDGYSLHSKTEAVKFTFFTQKQVKREIKYVSGIGLLTKGTSATFLQAVATIEPETIG